MKLGDEVILKVSDSLTVKYLKEIGAYNVSLKIVSIIGSNRVTYTVKLPNNKFLTITDKDIK